MSTPIALARKHSNSIISKKWKLGTCSVIATLDSAAGTVVHSASSKMQLHDPEYILSDGNIVALLLTKSLDEKLIRLDELLFRDGIPALLGNVDEEAEGYVAASPSYESMLALVVDAICADLANEIAAVLTTRWRSGLSSAQMERSLPLLHKVSRFRLSGMPYPPGSPGGNHLIRLVALTMYCARSQASWWEWLPPFAFSRRSIALRRHTKRLINDFVEASFGEHAKVARKHIKVAMKAEAKKRRSGVKMGLDSRKRWHYAQDLLLAPIERQGITTDAEVLGDPASRVLNRQEFDAIAESDLADDERRATLVSANLRSREALLVSAEKSLVATD